MSQPFVMIDGYNLLHAAGFARVRYGPGDLERIRHRFLAQLADLLTERERQRCTVVFDAQEAPVGLPRKLMHQELTVLFADPGQDADAFLELLIATHSASKQILLVSSDHRLQKAIRKRRGRSIDSELFWQHLQQRDLSQKHLSLQPKSPNKPDPLAEIDFWMTEFGALEAGQLAESDAMTPPATPESSPERFLKESGAGSTSSAVPAPVPVPGMPQRAADARWSIPLPEKSDWERHLDQFQKELEQLGDSADWLNSPPNEPGRKPPRA